MLHHGAKPCLAEMIEAYDTHGGNLIAVSPVPEDQAHQYGIVGVGTQPGDERMRDALIGQDCLYTLVVKHPDGRTDIRVIGSVLEYLYAPDDPPAVLDRLVHPDTRIVSLTITEGGYCLNQITGDFDPEDQVVREDVTQTRSPRTVFGYLVEALNRRRTHGTQKFKIL